MAAIVATVMTAIATIPVVAVTILAVVLLDVDALAQAVEAQVQVTAFLHRQAAATATVLDFKAPQAAELVAQAAGFRAGDLAAADALIDTAIQIGLTLIDGLPGGGLGGEGSS